MDCHLERLETLAKWSLFRPLLLASSFVVLKEFVHPILTQKFKCSEFFSAFLRKKFMFPSCGIAFLGHFLMFVVVNFHRALSPSSSYASLVPLYIDVIYFHRKWCLLIPLVTYLQFSIKVKTGFSLRGEASLEIRVGK